MKSVLRLSVLHLAFAVPCAAAEADAWKWQFNTRYFASGTKTIEEGGRGLGGFRAEGAEYGLRRRAVSGPRFNLTLGAEFERVSLGRSQAPLPDHLQAVSGAVTAGWVFNRKSWMTVNLTPGFYGDDDLLAQDFNMPVVLSFHSRPRSDLHLVGGLAVNVQRRLPVFPFAGAIWRLNERWNFRLTLPNARVEYRAYWTPKATVDLFTGVSISGGAYRVSKELGRRRGRPEIGGQILSVSTQQVLAGVRAAGGGLEAEVYGGWAFARRLEYSRPGIVLKSDRAPTLGVSLTARL